MKTGAELWPEAKRLLLPYIGAASQIYVLDLPLEKLGGALSLLSHETANLQVVTLDSETVDPIYLTGEVQENLLACSTNATNHVLRGEWAPGEVISAWLWIDAVQATFDIEFVFWANLLFPKPDDEVACICAFSHCISLVEKFRNINPGSECVLSESETGDPRDERDTPSTLFW